MKEDGGLGEEREVSKNNFNMKAAVVNKKMDGIIKWKESKMSLLCQQWGASLYWLSNV